MHLTACMRTSNGWLGLALCALATGCGRAESSPPANSMERYELVTVVRPASFAKRFAPAQALYDACVASAKILGRPVKAFIVLPHDFIEERNTYVRDGHSFYLKREGFDIDIETTRVENGCLTKPLYVSDTWIRHAAGGELISVDKDGQRKVQTLDPGAPTPFSGADLAKYSLRKSVRGVALRCLSADSPVIRGNLMEEDCIVDGAGGTTALDMNGQPVPAFFKDLTMASWTGVRTLEPLSLKIGQAIDPRIFDQAKEK